MNAECVPDPRPGGCFINGRPLFGRPADFRGPRCDPSSSPAPISRALFLPPGQLGCPHSPVASCRKAQLYRENWAGLLLAFLLRSPPLMAIGRSLLTAVSVSVGSPLPELAARERGLVPMISQRPTRSPHRGSAFLPAVETLEDRRVPAVMVRQILGSNVIFVNATGRHDVIRIHDTGGSGAGALAVTGTGLAAPFASAALVPGQRAVIDVFTGGGSDRIESFSPRRAPAAKASSSGPGRTLFVNLGAPGNRFTREVMRTVVLRSGVRARVDVNRSGQGTGLTLNFHG